ncbi:MAG: peptide chain release factor N(5)-glutamine methyltransferase [Allobranchiibius sp.]
MTVREILSAAATRLGEAGVVSAASDAAILLAHAWGVELAEVHRAQVLDRRPDVAVLTRFADLVSERASRIPLQHLTGRAPFRHLELAVGPGVFVPRPETEMLVDLVASHLQHGSPTVVDLCTGSGALAFAVKQEFPQTLVYAVELSKEAVAWAQLNRQLLGLDVDIRQGDATSAFDDLVGQVDVVLSNPPYIPDGMVPIDPEVRDHDPHLALFGGSADGLAIPVQVAARAARLLRPGGRLAMEHAATQGKSLPEAILAQGYWSEVEDHHDLTDAARVTVATKQLKHPQRRA